MRGYQTRCGDVTEIVKANIRSKPTAVRAEVKLRFTSLVKPNTSPSLVFGDASQSCSNSKARRVVNETWRSFIVFVLKSHCSN
jgi:hypothetical protein